MAVESIVETGDGEAGARGFLHRPALAREPFSIMADEPFVEELTALITRLAMGGLLKANQN